MSLHLFLRFENFVAVIDTSVNCISMIFLNMVDKIPLLNKLRAAILALILKLMPLMYLVDMSVQIILISKMF